MSANWLQLLVALSLRAALTLPARAADPPVSRRDADLLKQKIALIAERSGAAPSEQRLRTTVTPVTCVQIERDARADPFGRLVQASASKTKGRPGAVANSSGVCGACSGPLIEVVATSVTDVT